MNGSLVAGGDWRNDTMPGGEPQPDRHRFGLER